MTTNPLKNPRLIPRRVAARVLLVLVALLPAALVVFFFTGIFNEKEDATGMAIGFVVSAAFTALFVFLFAREQTYRLFHGDNGLQVTALGLTGIKTTTLLYSEIEETLLHAVSSQHGGGLLGVLAVAAVEAATKPKDGGINEHTNTITVTVKGAGKTLRFGNGNKGVMAVYSAVLDAVTPRLVEATLRTVRGGGTAKFGQLSLDSKSVFFGKAAIAYADVKELVVDNGTVRVKKEGAWFSKTVPASGVPNLQTFLDAFQQLSGTRS